MSKELCPLKKITYMKHFFNVSLSYLQINNMNEFTKVRKPDYSFYKMKPNTIFNQRLPIVQFPWNLYIMLPVKLPSESLTILDNFFNRYNFLDYFTLFPRIFESNSIFVLLLNFSIIRPFPNIPIEALNNFLIIKHLDYKVFG